MNQHEYDKRFDFNRIEEENWLQKKVKNFGAVLSPDGFKKALCRRMPIVKWLPIYQGTHFLTDVIAGITVGIYNVPQAMSYSVLAGLPPVYGLYASFFPPLIYTIFGTSKHASIGVFSITCLMINKCLQKMAKEDSVESYGVSKIEIATSLCLLTGLLQSIMSIIRCDKLMKFLSNPAISAITFSSCFYGILSQIPKMLGISVSSKSDKYFSLIYTIIGIIDNIRKTNFITLAISVSTILFLLIMKLKIEPKIKKSGLSTIPFPTELLVIVTMTLVSYYLQLEQKYGVKTINHVPRGFPEPSVPPFNLWPLIIKDSFSIAIVSYAVTISMGQIFSKKHKYQVDSNQELLALGVLNIASSFFSTFPTSASLSRTLINEGCGAKSQISGMVSCICIFFVITFIGPLLECLPNCVLSAIVTVAVRSLLQNYRDLPKLWKYSKHDFYIWILTTTVTLCTDIAEGVAAGLFFAIVTIAIQSQQPTIKQLGQVRTNDFRPINHYGSAKETMFKIIRFDAPLIFANVDKFLINVRDAAKEVKLSKSNLNPGNEKWTAIILDCHTWIYTDSMGIDAVKEIDNDLKDLKILPLFANLKSSLRRQYENAGILDQISFQQMYPSIQDALESAHDLLIDQDLFFNTDCVEKV